MKRGFSMVEMVVAIVVLAIIAAVLLPVINGSTDAYASSASSREGAERVAFAIDRSSRLLRDWPAGSTTTSVASVTFDGLGSLTYADGRGVGLSGTNLVLRDVGGGESVLCRDVESFTIKLLQSDGVTSATSDPTRTQRVNLFLKTKSAEMRTTVFVRARAVST